MKIERKLFKGNRRGYALLMTVTFVSIALLLLAGMMNWTSGSALQTERNNLYRESTSAADAATELAMGHMWWDFYRQVLGPASSYTAYLPDQTGWPVQFNFSNGARVQNHTGVITNSIIWTNLNSFGARYTGLSAYVVPCTVVASATTADQPYEVSATVQQNFDLAAIPIFQFAVFYNLNMEIDPGQQMTLSGPVFSNDGIWARGPNIYSSTVTAVGVVDTNGADPYVSGKSDGNQSVFNQGVSSNASSLTLPIGTNTSPDAVRALIGLPPSGTSPYSPAGQSYFVNEANLIISNSSGGVLTAYYQDPNATPPITQIPYNQTNNSYSFVTNVSFWDFREGKTVHAVQLSVSNLNTWLGSGGGAAYNNQMDLHSGHGINSVYIYNNNPLTSLSLPAVRVDDGAVLPQDGLTVVTPDPLYVLGNYNASGSSLNNGGNVSGTAPAALIGDAITVLSQNWNDQADTLKGSGSSMTARTPVATTINAATFEGVVQSSGNQYSGGVENFLRLLEDWGDTKDNNPIPFKLTYNGSIVVMFPSQYATNYWDNSNYYSVPKRVWAFDLNFMTQKGLPPLTPEVFALIRKTYTVYGGEVVP